MRNVYSMDDDIHNSRESSDRTSIDGRDTKQNLRTIINHLKKFQHVQLS